MKQGQVGEVSVAKVAVSFNRWGQTVAALRDITFNVAPGEWLLVVGPNGSGKSTLLKVLAGYIRPDEGEAKVSGRVVHNLRPGRLATTVFLVHQDPLLGTASLLTVFENMFVADPSAKRRGISKSKLRASYGQLLTSIGLGQRMDQPVKLLSGGERQLLAMAIASLREAGVVLLDEPLAALDAEKVALCIKLIERMHRDGKTIIQIAHDIHLLAPFADRILTLNAGRIVKYEKLEGALERSPSVNRADA